MTLAAQAGDEWNSGVFALAARLMRSIGWAWTRWDTFTDQHGSEIDLACSSAEYLRRRAAAAFNDMTARRALRKVNLHEVIFDDRPLRTTFTEATLRRTRIMARALVGNLSDGTKDEFQSRTLPGLWYGRHLEPQVL